MDIVAGSSEDPLVRLSVDRARAQTLEDPCANLCTLANVDANGLPQSRTLVLREIETRFLVFVNASSPKWSSMVEKEVSVVVWLPSIKAQYRLTCETEPVPAELVAESWLLRPDAPKRMDWYYSRIQAQSSVVASREQLLKELSGLDLPEPLRAPDGARGLYLMPSLVERLDLGQENGVHDRRQYRLSNPGWEQSVLAP